MWRIRLLLFAIVTCVTSSTSPALPDEADTENSVAARRAEFFAWCMGNPIIVPTPTYGKLAAIDRGCARLAQARAETYRALWDTARANRGRQSFNDFGRLGLTFPAAVCREMTARRLGGDPIDVLCSLRDQRMVDALLDLPGIYDIYRRQIDALNAKNPAAPWNQAANARIAHLLDSDPSATGLRRYLEKIGCRCEATAAQSLSCSLLFEEIGYQNLSAFMGGVVWTIRFKRGARGEATDIEALVDLSL